MRLFRLKFQRPLFSGDLYRSAAARQRSKFNKSPCRIRNDHKWKTYGHPIRLCQPPASWKGRKKSKHTSHSGGYTNKGDLLWTRISKPPVVRININARPINNNRTIENSSWKSLSYFAKILCTFLFYERLRFHLHRKKESA